MRLSDFDNALVNLFAVAGQVNRLVGVLDVQTAALYVHADVLILGAEAVQYGGHSSRARARAASPGLARAALPHAHLDVRAAYHGHEFDIGALREYIVILQQRAYLVQLLRHLPGARISRSADYPMDRQVTLNSCPATVTGASITGSPLSVVGTFSLSSIAGPISTRAAVTLPRQEQLNVLYAAASLYVHFGLMHNARLV